MKPKITRLARPADPSISRVLDEFLEEQRTQRAPRTHVKYEGVLELLQHHLNGYGYESLSKAEAALFDRHFNAEGDEHREFCELFGPEKIAENLGSFLGYFMVRKVLAGEDFKRTAGTVTKKLSKWLAASGYVSLEVSEEAADIGAIAARDLPSADRAGRIIRDAMDRPAIDPTELAKDNYLEFDHCTIVRVEPGKLWLAVHAGQKRRVYGPVAAPEPATKLLREGWELSCSLGRVRGAWRIVEFGNVYPN